MPEKQTVKPVVEVLQGRSRQPPPIWIMRQAGRYLPEYRAIREKVTSFLDLCLTPDLAAEVTLQPVRRLGFDAAILFSDILVIPYALGRRVSFEAGGGPRLDPITGPAALAGVKEEMRVDTVAPVYEAIRQVKAQLPATTALLGFCGAPWTVATYMIAGSGIVDQAPARLFAYRNPEAMHRLIGILERASIAYLVGQLRAGVDAVQIFDTWAGVLPPEEFHRWCVGPAARIVAGVRRDVPDAKIIGFPRGAGSLLSGYVDAVPVNAVGLDWTIDRTFARECLQSRVAVQGNLDPLALVVGGEALDRAVDAVLEAFAAGPFIFNLGHGILPQTPIAHVERLIARVRAGKG